MELPDDIRVLNVLGAEYYIQWERLSRGASFFLPTTATATQVRMALKPAAEFFDFAFTAHARREYGLYGVRVWRTY
jgi:hypothetical protein